MGIQNRTVSVQMPFGTDLKELTASFSTNADKVMVGAVEQISGVTKNDFSQPVVYRLETETGYNDWTVNVTVVEPGKDPNLKFTSFTVPGGGMVGTENNTVYVAVKNGTSLSSLVPTFTTNAGRVYVGKTEQTSGVSANDFSKDVVYILESEKGTNEITVKTTQYNFTLPVLFVTSPVSISSITKDDWVGGTQAALFDSETGAVDILGAADEAEDIAVNEFKGRGNSTWGYPKKPYTIKFAQKESLLGMPKDKRWNLLANWMDVTGMRNEIALELARRSPGFAWTPRGKYVELVYNGKHNGNYYLCEHIKISKDRVNITAYDEDAPAPANEIGYLLEFDVNYDEANKFRTASLDLPVNVKDPDAEGFDLSYISGWVNSLEDKLTSGSISTSDYRDYLDIDSFIDWFFVHELTGNWEPSHPKSSYMYKDGELAEDHKIHAGPCWDFDYQTFVTGKNDKLAIYTYPRVLWYNYLFADPVFVARLKEKWAAQMESYKDVASTHINQVAGQISSSIAVDKAMWPLAGKSTVNGDESLGFYDAALRIQTNLLTKIANMDGWIKSL